MGLGGKDIYEAQQAWNILTAEEPDTRSYAERAFTYMYQGHYTNAVADYEKALVLWDQRDLSGNVSKAWLSNHLYLARICAQIQSNQVAGEKFTYQP